VIDVTGPLSLEVIFVVLAAGLIHAIWNAVVKSFDDQDTSFFLLNVGSLLLCGAILPVAGLPLRSSWSFVAASTLCHLLYQTFLMGAYRHGAFSRSYPIARGTAPLLGTLGGVILSPDSVSLGALLGIAAIVAGIVSLAAFDANKLTRRAVGWAVITGVMIAAYTVIDGIGSRHAHSPLKYLLVISVAQNIIFASTMWHRRRKKPWPLPPTLALGLAGGGVSALGYFLVLWAQSRASIGIVSALRETGVVWGAFIGVVVSKEKGGWRIMVAAISVAAGIILITLGR